MTKFYVDQDGAYIGGFDGADPPAGAIEVPIAPKHAANVWTNGAWQAAQIVPQSVPMLNAHLILIGAGWMPAVRTYLDAIQGAEGEQARAYFDKALTMKRNHPLVLGIPESLMTESQKDELFIAAGALDA